MGNCPSGSTRYFEAELLNKIIIPLYLDYLPLN